MQYKKMLTVYWDGDETKIVQTDELPRLNFTEMMDLRQDVLGYMEDIDATATEQMKKLNNER